jgi:hypothetical protein
MQEDGNLRTSHRESNAIRRKIAPKAIQQRARDLVESVSRNGCIIRQRLDTERMKQPLQKGVFYVIENNGICDPGFLVFLPGQAPVFLQMKPKAPPPCTLRMRVSPTLGENGGSVFIATLDTVEHSLRIEDVWMWKGAPVFDSETYSKRRAYLKTFVENLWIPDVRLLGGITTTVLNPRSVRSVFESGQYDANALELLPDAPGRRRMWISVNGDQKRPDERRVQAPKPQVPLVVPVPVTVPVPAQPDKIVRKARAVAVEKMPDIYEIFDEQGFPISRASVQSFSLSQQLRGTVGPEGVWVMIRWRSEFGGYEIISKV